MTVKTVDRSQMLRLALKSNGSFSALSGLALTVASRPIAAFMGFDRPGLFLGLGVVLLIFGADLWWLATRHTVDSRMAWGIVALDVLWVVGSALLLISGIAGFNSAGRWIVLIIADIVAVFALWQAYGIWMAKIKS